MATLLSTDLNCGVGWFVLMDVDRTLVVVFSMVRDLLRLDAGLIALGPTAVNMVSDGVDEP